jgi:hypothetical protein
LAAPPIMTKRRTRAAIKLENQSILLNRRPTRKRKQSTSDENDPKSTTIVLRKRKPVCFTETEETNTKIQKKKTSKKKNTKKKIQKANGEIKHDIHCRLLLTCLSRK